jgi:hypothetical protein
MFMKILEKTAIMRVLSRNAQRMFRDLAPIVMHSARITKNIAIESNDLGEKFPNNTGKSDDFAFKSSDPAMLLGDPHSMSQDSVMVFRGRLKKSKGPAPLSSDLRRKCIDFLCRPIHCLRASFRAYQAGCERRRKEFDALFVIDYLEADVSEYGMRRLRDEHYASRQRYHVPERYPVLEQFLSVPFVEIPPPLDRKLVLAILLALAKVLLGWFVAVVRSVSNWQPPLHSSAACSPRGSRPPPLWAVHLSVR